MLRKIDADMYLNFCINIIKVHYLLLDTQIQLRHIKSHNNWLYFFSRQN